MILRPVAVDDDPWGCLTSLQGTPWGDLVSVVTGEALSHALHGYGKPLLDMLRRAPLGSAKSVPPAYRQCEQYKTCLMAAEHCTPGPDLPDCYVPPVLETQAQKEAAALVAISWAENRYVIVVVGEEFSI